MALKFSRQSGFKVMHQNSQNIYNLFNKVFNKVKILF